MPLQYELEVLDEFISNTLNPKGLLFETTLNDQQFENWCAILLTEKEGIRKRLKRVTYSYKKESHRKLYIQQHQYAICRLKNQLVDFLMPKDASVLAEQKEDPNIVRLYKRSLLVLQELMGFIREEFRKYFNEDEAIPSNRLLIIQHDVKERLHKVKRALTKTGHDKGLIELVLQTITIHCNNETCQALTYRRYSYIKFVLSSLEKVNPEELQALYYPPLPTLLVYLNFNATAFKNYLVKKIHADINACETIEKKIEMISLHHKEISQLPVKPDMALAPTLRSVQLDLVTWLFTEMTHLEKKATLAIVAPVQFKEPDDPDGEKRYLFHPDR